MYQLEFALTRSSIEGISVMSFALGDGLILSITFELAE